MPRLAQRRRSGFTLIELMVVVGIIAIMASIVVPSFVRSRQVGRYTACKSNLKNIATAVDVYANDNNGRYPTDMASLRGQHLSVIPTCPSAFSDTYSAGFTSSSNPDGYTVVCSGDNHLDVGQDTAFPQYISGEGLVTL